jgi:glycosyltransferase involved in cell wall biosynthesis
LYKEVILARRSGYQAEIICFDFDNWSKQINEQLIRQLADVKIITIPAGRTRLLTWFWSVFTETIFRKVAGFFALPLPALSQAVSRRSSLLINKLNKVSKPDLVIGHNLGALWPALVAARKFNCRVGFDVEDYHPGEGNEKHLQSLSRCLMVSLLPKMDYVSFSAPLILEQVKRDVSLDSGKCNVVLNYSPVSDFMEPGILIDGPLKLVWFSQNINTGRGLELILPFVKKAASKLELHLIGNLDPDFYADSLKGIPNIHLHPPMRQTELHQTLQQFDIGLALEPAKDKNNELAISNKLLAYLQAGLFVVATNTPAQESFLNKMHNHGICFDYQTNNAEIVFERILKDIDNLRFNKSKRYDNFKDKNWETTAEHLLNVWNRNL